MQKVLSYLIKKSLGFYINILSYIKPGKASRLAYKFFSEPRDGRLVKGQLPEILQEAKAEIITHNEFIFQMYTWPGNEVKVLLVHGWESNTSRWASFIPYLKETGCTVIALDAPAHGLSGGKEFNIPRYAEFIDVVVHKHKPQYMVGHSVGGATALYYQSHYQNGSIEKMVVLGAPCDLTTILNNYAGLLSLNSKVFRLMEMHFMEHFKINVAEFCGSLFAKKIQSKGLIAHDVDDDVVAFKEGRKIAEAWPGAEFIATKGLGHSMHDESLYRKIHGFLFKEQPTP